MAIAITTAMDANGLSAFSALPLCPLMLLFWYLDGLKRTEIGFVWGPIRDYGLAVLHSCLVLGLIVLLAWITGALDLEKSRGRTAGINFAIVALSTFLVAMITEEGFFRGWLWASLKRAGQSDPRVLAWTSLSFALWHLSAVLLETGFNPPLRQVPVFMVNAAVLARSGACCGCTRSIVVSSLAHGVWNGVLMCSSVLEQRLVRWAFRRAASTDRRSASWGSFLTSLLRLRCGTGTRTSINRRRSNTRYPDRNASLSGPAILCALPHRVYPCHRWRGVTRKKEQQLSHAG